MLKKVIENDNQVNYVPRVTFRNQLKVENAVNQIWKLIQQSQFENKELWELSFYDYIDDTLINDELSIH